MKKKIISIIISLSMTLTFISPKAYNVNRCQICSFIPDELCVCHSFCDVCCYEHDRCFGCNKKPVNLCRCCRDLCHECCTIYRYFDCVWCSSPSEGWRCEKCFICEFCFWRWRIEWCYYCMSDIGCCECQRALIGDGDIPGVIVKVDFKRMSKLRTITGREISISGALSKLTVHVSQVAAPTDDVDEFVGEVVEFLMSKQ